MTKKILKIRDKTIFDGVIAKYFLKSIFSVWFKIAGWKITRTTPEGAGVAIAAPHTSNWDFIYALGAAILQDIKIYFSIKDTWCRAPLVGNVMMWLGAIPIDRSAKGRGQVELIKEFVEQHKNERIFFLFTPEGTRGKATKWKTGFYHVAQSSGIPIFLAKVDYKKKESGVFHSYQLTGDKDEDIEAIQASYKTVQGKFTELQFPHYVAPLPTITETEANVMHAMYSLKGVATSVEIAAKAKLGELSKPMMDFLIEKGVIEKVASLEAKANANIENINNFGNEIKYRLTEAGRGCLLHLYPTLAVR